MEKKKATVAQVKKTEEKAGTMEKKEKKPTRAQIYSKALAALDKMDADVAAMYHNLPMIGTEIKEDITETHFQIKSLRKRIAFKDGKLAARET